MNTYPTSQQLRTDERAMREWHATVATAAGSFERRWTMPSLRRVDAVLASRLLIQQGLFDQAMIDGSAAQIHECGSSLCRAYQMACGALESAGAPDDAYQLGLDPATGVRVAIGIQRAACERLKELYGDGVIFVTPDEVAVMIASTTRDGNAGNFIGAVKRLFPGAVMG